MQKRLYLFVTMLLFVVNATFAQVTTSSINGKVVAGGEDVIGATVVAIHKPSGTRYSAATNVKGRYSIQGMRVGGPYTITISYIGYKDDVKQNVSLELGEAFVFNADLKEDAQALGEVVVTGQAGNQGNGASSNFSTQQIENTPTVTRNIYDVAKMSPLVNNNKNGGITIAGSNNRYNSFQIDGMVSNDVFGLSSSGTNGGQTGANPLSLDAIEQIQVVASPFDVRQSGFTGGAINAITKSGTNEFKGSAYTYYTDENLYGRHSVLKNKSEKLTDETDKTYGFTLGGPILKDKLFLFASMEYRKKSYPGSYYPGVTDNYFMTTDIADQVLAKYKNDTGYEDSYTRRDVDTRALSLMGRLDWNINTNNKLSFRYQLNNSFDDKWSAGVNSYTFNNSSYRQKNKTNSFVLELNSNISPSLYNEFRAGATFVRDHRESPYPGPTVYITSSPAFSIGTEYSSGVNSLDQDIYTIEDNLSWYLGNHAITFGTHNEIYNMKNGFIQAANGEFTYKSIGDYLNDKAQSYVWKYSDPDVTGTSRWETPFKAGQFGLYVQDKWDVNTKLQFTYGLRFDIPVYFNDPTTNKEFNASDWSKKYGAVIGRKPGSYVMVSPRLGFRWFANDNHSTLVRGGVGIFNGRAPFVWIENAWANTGIEMKGTTIHNDNVNSISMAELGKKSPAEVVEILKSKGAEPSAPDIVTVAENFKFPQVFRANLAVEQQLPWGIKGTLEALYSKNLNNVWFENYALVDNGKKVYAVGGIENSTTPFYSSVRGAYNTIINMKNTNKGYSYSFSAKLEKSFDFGLDVMASYTFGHSYSVNDGTSSVANSNWKYYYCVDPNKQTLAKSMFDVPHRVLVSLNYNTPKYGNGRWQTHVGLTYNGNSGQRYSLTMSDAQSASFNGDFAKGNTLLYIPTVEELEHMTFVDVKDKDGNVTMTAQQSKDAFGKWIENDDYAKDHRGQYAERNSNLANWENRIDLHVAQDFFYLKNRGSKVELTFDVYNFANMLNKNWGVSYSSAYNQNILQCEGVDQTADGNKIAKFSYKGYGPQKSDIYSRWHAQIGLRVTF